MAGLPEKNRRVTVIVVYPYFDTELKKKMNRGDLVEVTESRARVMLTTNYLQLLSIKPE